MSIVSRAFGIILQGLNEVSPVKFIDRKRHQASDSAQDILASEEERFDSNVREYYSTVDSGRRAQSAIYQSLWLKEMARRLLPFEAAPAEKCDEEEVQEATRALMSLLLSTMKGLVLEFNALILDIPVLLPLRISTVEVSEVREEISHQQGRESANVTFLRCRASSATWSICMRGSRGRIEFFLVPVNELFLFSQSETPVRLKNVVQMYDRTVPEGIWTIDGLPADPDELYYLVRTLFKTLVLASVQGFKQERLGSSMLLSLEGEALRKAVLELLLAEQNMAQKIVSQHEEIQNRIARDLHDAVIADVMSIQRQLTSDKHPTNEELIDGLDHICRRLREICHDLAPRDLIDWGLQTVVEDMLERVGERTGADCSFVCDRELPELPYPVQLHIYRIVQECLNNIEKYAQATRVMVNIDVTDKTMVLSIKDNGKGFSLPDSDLRSEPQRGYRADSTRGAIQDPNRDPQEDSSQNIRLDSYRSAHKDPQDDSSQNIRLASNPNQDGFRDSRKDPQEDSSQNIRADRGTRKDPRRAKEGGTGMSGIKERAEMIRCFYPARLRVESEPGKGSTTVLEIEVKEKS